ncbi:hypothetical protein GWK47_052906 [Chionoecetes opilio]|uniref:Uncharacterized protein n=1 Tax=Chionoecetes opilio TaxID=41210 RepID=A0A8J4YBA3_CHIOP|nr:hypothetical protein GWK47_052906 [Chionoecetes opilio]
MPAGSGASIESADPGHAPRAHDVRVLLRLWPSSAPFLGEGTGRGTVEYGLVFLARYLSTPSWNPCVPWDFPPSRGLGGGRRASIDVLRLIRVEYTQWYRLFLCSFPLLPPRGGVGASCPVSMAGEG